MGISELCFSKVKLNHAKLMHIKRVYKPNGIASFPPTSQFGVRFGYTEQVKAGDGSDWNRSATGLCRW
jgi:hypothetical protein